MFCESLHGSALKETGEADIGARVDQASGRRGRLGDQSKSVLTFAHVLLDMCSNSIEQSLGPFLEVCECHVY